MDEKETWQACDLYLKSLLCYFKPFSLLCKNKLSFIKIKDIKTIIKLFQNNFVKNKRHYEEMKEKENIKHKKKEMKET